MINLDFPSLLSSNNLRAFLRVIREGESWNDRDDLDRDELAFRVRYHPTKFPTLFDSFDQHPRVFEPLTDGTNRRSSASGAFQITATTWDDMRGRYAGFGPTFTPWDQMACAVALIHTQGALDDVIAGRLDTALAKCGPRWASLPSSPLQDGGSKISYDRARVTYVTWGGALEHEEQAPAPIEDRSTPARPEDVDRITEQEAPSMGPAAFILPLLQSLFSIFTPLAQAKLGDALNKQVKDPAMSQAMAEQIMAMVKAAAGMTVPPTPHVAPAAPTPVADEVIAAAQAVAAVKANPTLVATVEQDVLAYLDRIQPMIDRISSLEQQAWAASESSMAAAAQRVADDPNAWDARRALIGSSIVGVAILVLFVCGILAVQVYRGIEVGVEIWAALTGLIGWVTAKAGTLWDYYFGSSRTSSTKDTAIAELAASRNR